VQYIVIRSDLIADKRWGMGKMVAQGCHASVAAIILNLADADTAAYVNDHTNMTKTVLIVDNEKELLELSKELKSCNVNHHLWVETPENVPTALASTPQLKSFLLDYFGHFPLLK